MLVAQSLTLQPVGVKAKISAPGMQTTLKASWARTRREVRCIQATELLDSDDPAPFSDAQWALAVL
jgi:hypothetical protein